MGQISPHLRRVKAADHSIGYGHYCPGCDRIHIFWTATPPPRPKWDFNGNLEKPSFTPSMRIFHPAHNDGEFDHPEETVCHYILTDGVINYCGDSAHTLKGQRVPLPELPARFGDDHYAWPSD